MCVWLDMYSGLVCLWYVENGGMYTFHQVISGCSCVTGVCCLWSRCLQDYEWRLKPECSERKKPFSPPWMKQEKSATAKEEILLTEISNPVVRSMYHVLKSVLWRTNHTVLCLALPYIAIGICVYVEVKYTGSYFWIFFSTSIEMSCVLLYYYYSLRFLLE